MKVPVIGDTLTLTGITSKGKQRLQQWGHNGWEVTKIVDEVQFSNEVGPWLFVDPGNNSASRWIHALNDKDFSFIIVECNS